MADEGIPTRMFMDDPNIQWRKGKPDYTKTNQLYLEGRTKKHAPGSIEKLVSDLLKTFEMEVQHKTRLEDFGTITPDFKMSINGGRSFTAKELMDRGTYNLFLYDSPLYDASRETFQSADALFAGVFTTGFAWEVLEVIHGPPKLVFTWRHWSSITGSYKGRQPTGESVEMFGCVVADVTNDHKLRTVDFYFDGNPLMAKLQGKCPFATERSDDN